MDKYIELHDLIKTNRPKTNANIAGINANLYKGKIANITASIAKINPKIILAFLIIILVF